MKINEIMDRALFALSVPKCTCCKAKLSYGEKGLCPKCSAVFSEFKSRNCSRCAKKLSSCSCSNEYLSGHFVSKVIKCFRYLSRNESAPGNSLIYSLKRDNRRDVLDRCRDEICSAIRNSIKTPESYIYTNVPRRKPAIVEFGIDHSALLARAVAAELGGEYRSLLGSKAKYAQKSLDPIKRFENARFYITKDIDLSGKKVMIIDDIITTGASVAKSAALIRSLGCREIVAATLAIAYKDN